MLTKPVNNPDHSKADQVDNLFWIRRQLLKGMLIALVVLGLPAVVISCIEAIKLGQLGGTLLYGGIYLIVSATTLFFHRLPFVFCAGIMLASLYMIAVFNFFYFSFSGAGIEIFITISVLATVLSGIQSGLMNITKGGIMAEKTLITWDDNPKVLVAMGKLQFVVDALCSNIDFEPRVTQSGKDGLEQILLELNNQLRNGLGMEEEATG